MKKNDFMMENLYGDWIYQSWVPGESWEKNPNPQWLMVPVLCALQKVYGTNTAVEWFMEKLEEAFPHVLIDEDESIHFDTVHHCKFEGVTGTGSIQGSFKELKTKLEETVRAILSRVDTIQAEMAKVDPDVVLHEGFMSNKTGYVKHPVRWSHSPFSIAIRKVMPKYGPNVPTTEAIRGAERCYKCIDLLYLNETIRCFAEPNSIKEERILNVCEGLRSMLFCNWSLGVILNIMAAYVARVYVQKIWNGWKISRFQGVSITMAAQSDLQGFGALSLGHCCIMALSAIPLMLGLHIPEDPVFLPFKDRPTPLVREFWIMLSLTWFVRVGMEVSNSIIYLKRKNWWFLILESRLKHIILILIFAIRMMLIQEDADYSYGIYKISVTCICAIILGMGFLAFSVMVKAPEESKEKSVDTALHSVNAPRNRFGIQGCDVDSYCLGLMTLEGWDPFRDQKGSKQMIKKNIIMRIDGDHIKCTENQPLKAL